MKKVLFFVAAICCSTVLFAQSAQWFGNAYLVVGEKWYNVSNEGDASTDKLPESLGSLSALNIGAQTKAWGDTDPESNPAFIAYRFDDLTEWHEIELKVFRKESDNNNFFGCGGADPEPVYPVVAAEGFDALSNAEHTLEFYYYKASSHSSAYEGKLYIKKDDTHNFTVKFTKTPATAIDHVVGNAAQLKVMENGVLYIYRNGVKFDAQGKAVR